MKSTRLWVYFAVLFTVVHYGEQQHLPAEPSRKFNINYTFNNMDKLKSTLTSLPPFIRKILDEKQKWKILKMNEIYDLIPSLSNNDQRPTHKQKVANKHLRNRYSSRTHLSEFNDRDEENQINYLYNDYDIKDFKKCLAKAKFHVKNIGLPSRKSYLTSDNGFTRFDPKSVRRRFNIFPAGPRQSRYNYNMRPRTVAYENMGHLSNSMTNIFDNDDACLSKIYKLIINRLGTASPEMTYFTEALSDNGNNIDQRFNGSGRKVLIDDPEENLVKETFDSENTGDKIGEPIRRRPGRILKNIRNSYIVGPSKKLDRFLMYKRSKYYQDLTHQPEFLKEYNVPQKFHFGNLRTGQQTCQNPPELSSLRHGYRFRQPKETILI